MTTQEKIDAYFADNSSRQISEAKLREVMTELNAGLESEKQIKTWLNVPNYEVTIEHSLNSNLLDVHIFIVDGDSRKKIQRENYTVFCEDNGSARVLKTVEEFWNNAEVVLVKLY